MRKLKALFASAFITAAFFSVAHSFFIHPVGINKALSTCSLYSAFKNLAIFNDEITSAMQSRNYSEVITLYEQMKTYSIKPDVRTFNKLIVSCAKGLYWSLTFCAFVHCFS